MDAELVWKLDPSWRSSKSQCSSLESKRPKSLPLEQPTRPSVLQSQNFRLQIVESKNPYLDFRKSMEEMVMDYYGFKDSQTSDGELRDIEYLEELLGCYLRLNEKKYYRYIVKAFIHLCAALPSSASSSSCSSTKSPNCWQIVLNSSKPDVMKGKSPMIPN